jgi:hypothetical protein
MTRLILFRAAIAACGFSSMVTAARAAPPLPPMSVRARDATAYAAYLGHNGRTLSCNRDTCSIRYVVNEPPDRQGHTYTPLAWTTIVTEHMVEGGLYSFSEHRYIDRRWYLEVSCSIAGAPAELFSR